jgi:heat shock protein HslJ
MSTCVALLVLGFAGFLVGRTRGQEPVPAASQPPTLEELKNAAYQGLRVSRTPITLKDGIWELERARVTFARGFRRDGDLNGDGIPETVVLLAESTGGSGELVYVAVVERKGTAVNNVATREIGPRVQLRDARIENRKLILDIVEAGPQDAMCCPGRLSRVTLALGKGGLRELPRTAPPGVLRPRTLEGTEWVLRSWSWKDAAPDTSSITLQYRDGRFVGNSGCNRYVAPIKAGDAPGDIAVGHAAGTRMACPDPAGALESRFLAQLGGVRKFGFMAGQLALTYTRDGVTDVMLFDAQPAP